MKIKFSDKELKLLKNILEFNKHEVYSENRDPGVNQRFENIRNGIENGENTFELTTLDMYIIRHYMFNRFRFHTSGYTYQYDPLMDRLKKIYNEIVITGKTTDKNVELI